VTAAGDDAAIDAFAAGLAATGPSGAGVADTLARPISEGGAAASFAGLSVRAARRVVYVVDASGAMVTSLHPIVVDELAASIERLEPAQQFGVVVFGGGARTPPGQETLRAATPANKAEVIAWARDLAARGVSDPLDGLEPAFGLKPDLIFMLARSIRRSGADAKWGRGRAETLRTVERLNPRDDRTGRRPVVIKTVQFFDADPTGLMESLAGLHGDGAGDTRVITPDQFGRLNERREGPEAVVDLAEPEPDPVGPALAEAVAVLGDAERSGAALRTLYGLATAAERRATAQAAAATLRAIDADAVLNAEAHADDERIAAARARAMLLRAAAGADDERRRLLAELPAVLGPEREALDSAALARELTRVSAARLAGNGADRRRLLATVLASPLRPGLLRGLAGEIELERAAGATEPLEPPEIRPFYDEVSRTSDPGWSLLFAEAQSAARLASATPAAVVEPLLELVETRRVLRTDRERLSLVRPRLAVAVEALAASRGEGVIDELPAEAVVAAARAVEANGDTERATELLLSVAERDAGPGDRAQGDALRDAARIARESGDPVAAAELLARLAREHPRHPAADEAIAGAVALASGPRQVELLRTALAEHGEHPQADAWRLLLAGRLSDMSSFGLLDAVDRSGPWAEDAPRMALSIADRLLAETPEPSTALLRRSVEAANAVGRADEPARRARLAERLLSEDVAEAEVLFRALFAAGFEVPGGQDGLALGRARALVGLGRDREAAALLRPIVARLNRSAINDPARRTDVFWGANTLWLEVVARNGGAGRSIAAHVTKLRLADPRLGGEPWRARLEALAGRAVD